MTDKNCPSCNSPFKHDIVKCEGSTAIYFAGDVCTNPECGLQGGGTFVDRKTAMDMLEQDREGWRDRAEQPITPTST